MSAQGRFLPGSGNGTHLGLLLQTNAKSPRTRGIPTSFPYTFDMCCFWISSERIRTIAGLSSRSAQPPKRRLPPLANVVSYKQPDPLEGAVGMPFECRGNVVGNVRLLSKRGAQESQARMCGRNSAAAVARPCTVWKLLDEHQFETSTRSSICFVLILRGTTKQKLTTSKPIFSNLKSEKCGFINRPGRSCSSATVVVQVCHHAARVSCVSLRCTSDTSRTPAARNASCTADVVVAAFSLQHSLRLTFFFPSAVSPGGDNMIVVRLRDTYDIILYVQ